MMDSPLTEADRIEGAELLDAWNEATEGDSADAEVSAAQDMADFIHRLISDELGNY